MVCVTDAPEQDNMKNKSVQEGESVILDPGVVKTTNYLMKWIFNKICIAKINEILVLFVQMFSVYMLMSDSETD